MKASELRIGNWVDNGIPMQVTSDIIQDIEKDYNRGYFLPFKIDVYWLEILGFEDFTEDKKWFRKKNQNFDIDVYYTHSGGDWFVHVNGERTHHKYVHQLQNLYFALTGEELVYEK